MLDWDLNVESLLFLIFAGLAIAGAILMINLTKVVHMAIALASVFLSIAGLYFLLEAPFVGVVQILVYTGAVSILMLFGVMLTHQREEDSNRSIGNLHSFLSFFAVLLLLLAIMWVLHNLPASQSVGESSTSSLEELGKFMLTNYLVAFEAVSIILLIALIGAVQVARNTDEGGSDK